MTLKKHMVTNHGDPKCKECHEKIPSFMELHLAQQHCKNKSDKNEDKEKEDRGKYIDNDIIEEEEKAAKDKVFLEFMLDKFLIRGVHDRRKRPLTGY